MTTNGIHGVDLAPDALDQVQQLKTWLGPPTPTMSAPMIPS